MIKLIFLTVFTWTSPDAPADSLRLETINGKVFIIHKVSEKETLYSISRRYGTPITAVLEFNPDAAKGLEIGQILQVLYVPKNKVLASEGTTHKVAPKETLYSIAKLYSVTPDELKAWNNLKDENISQGQELIIRKPAQAKELVKSDTKNSGSHVVEPKETLYSIARTYGITVQQLKTWNSIPGDEVKVGQALVVVQPGTALVTESVGRKDEIKVVTTKEEVKPSENTIRISENVHGTDEVKEGGLAELIEGTEGNRKYLALHRTAKTGAIIKVRNELNNREVFVRVVGPLPGTGVNENIVIKISKSAFDRLGAIDPRFRVEVTYYK